ncbi:unnamed protein product [Periconia digitata]|uniref:Uncharacterized protein n=1 Tax=Periconia digitata TaxID=1303443 RepID=A0A9W4UHM9_9PLEO|nr:unnamed protein product [Periconia digitata]
MAPRRGGSSGGGSSSSGGLDSSPACPGAFTGYRGFGTTIVIFVGVVLFCFFTLLVHIGLCCVRKRHRGLSTKKLLGPIYITALSFMLFSWILTIITVVLAECGVSAYMTPLYLSIVYSLFFRLGTFLLLCVVVWSINSMLRERLSRKGQLGIHKMVPIALLAIMGVLTAVYIGISSYLVWASGQFDSDGYDGYRLRTQKLRLVLPKLYQAYVALYIVSLAVGYGLALHSIFALRSRVRTPVSDLILWTSIIFATLILSSIFDISGYSTSMRFNVSQVTGDALYYVENLFQILGFAAILFLAKCRSWELATIGGTDVNVTSDMGQYPYDAAQQQQGYYPQTYQTTQHSGYNQAPNEMPAAAPVQGYVR